MSTHLYASHYLSYNVKPVTATEGRDFYHGSENVDRVFDLAYIISRLLKDDGLNNCIGY